MLVFVYIYISNKNREKNYDAYENAFIISAMIFSLFESLIVSPGIPVSIIFWYYIFVKNKKSEKN
ncbi:hypothetical protein [Oceanotoga teriensis]|uniref:hypothetical protein n=1 Tax=Oceanotoga teriensis TaxID=515440 RepID=UPI0027124778|nr:hypothetical protein [Oceanotoga teriensis]MDO7975858.1 hypothetical protein [Oceanotoga teriensis]